MMISQVCAGYSSGCEAAIHALRKVFAAMSTDAVLLVDADNAFKHLNRAVALHNIRYTCPPLAMIRTNIYRAPSRVFVTGEMELSPEEETTQGCPLSMAMYALISMPLINKCQRVISINDHPRAVQVWYADDVATGGNHITRQIKIKINFKNFKKQDCKTRAVSYCMYMYESRSGSDEPLPGQGQQARGRKVDGKLTTSHGCTVWLT